jgi:uncharacterized protein (TIGR03067 family)
MKPSLRLMLMVAFLVGCGKGDDAKTSPGPTTTRANGGEKKSDTELILGTWLAESAEFEGKQSNKAQLAGSKLTVATDHMIFRDGPWAPGADKTRYKLDSEKKPKEINITRKEMVEEPKGGRIEVDKTELAIYSLDGDTLKVCVGRGKERPKEFDSKQGLLWVWRRSK